MNTHKRKITAMQLKEDSRPHKIIKLTRPLDNVKCHLEELSENQIGIIIEYIHNKREEIFNIQSLAVVSKKFAVIVNRYFKKEKNCKIRSSLLCQYIASSGYLTLIKYAHDAGCRWDEFSSTYAAMKGHLEVLKYLHENGCPWDEYTTVYAELECLKYAHQNGCIWTEITCEHAASRGDLNTLKYAHEHGCPWDERTCINASSKGHLACLQYAHDHGCPWDEYTCFYAATRGHLNCLKYAYENNCPCDKEAILLQCTAVDCREYILYK
jgi:hypothetical protein